MTRRVDLDESASRDAATLLAGQRAAYSALLLELEAHAPVQTNLDELRELTIATSRILHPLAGQREALTALAGRLRRPGCSGPRADATRVLFDEVGKQASSAGARLEQLIGALREDQGKTLADIKDLGRGTPSPYQGHSVGTAALVDRTG
jgi:hypothetical protein